MMSCAMAIMTSFIIPYLINSQYLKMWGVDSSGIHLVPVVQKMDSAIHRINHYSVDKC